jgi:GntR family transcriptional regulator, carbon starvation induced regulator
LSKAQEALNNGLPGAAAEWELRNHQFHEATTAACGSRWLLRMLNILHHHTERYRRLALTDRSIPRDVQAEHQALMEATLARDADTACDVAAAHIQRTTDVLAALYGKAMSDAG